MIRLRSWVIHQNMKKQIKERILIGRWKVALNRRLLDNTSAVGESDKNLMMGASNNVAAVKNASTNLVVRGGLNDCAAASMMGAVTILLQLRMVNYTRWIIPPSMRCQISYRRLI